MNISARGSQLFPYLVLLLFIVFLALRIVIVSVSGTDIAGIEQNVIYSIQMLMFKNQLYNSPAVPPFSITQYTPLYYYLCSCTAKVLGFSADDIRHLYIIGRSWNVVFNLSTAVMVFGISRSVLLLSKNKSYLLFLLSFTLSFSHNFAVRPDSLGDMMGIAAIYSFLLYLSRPSFKLLILAVCFTAISFFSKQSGIQLIIIFGGFCLLNKRWKTLFQLLFLTAFVYGAILTLFISLYPSFFDNVIGGVINGINVQNFIQFIILKPVFIFSIWPLIVISMVVLFKERLLLNRDAPERLLALSVLGTFLFATITALKMGSTIQYYVLFVNLALLMIFKGTGEKSPGHAEQPYVGMDIKKITFGIFLLLIIGLYAAYNVKLIINQEYNPKLARQRKAAIQVAGVIGPDHLKRSGAYLFANLSTDSTLPSRQGLNNIFYENCLVPQMDILEYSTKPSKVIGYRRLEDMLKNGEVAYIIESIPIPKFSIIKNLPAIKAEKFRLIKTIEGYSIYKRSSN